MPFQKVDVREERALGLQKSTLGLSGMLGQETKKKKEAELSTWSEPESFTPGKSPEKKKRQRKSRRQSQPEESPEFKAVQMPPISPPKKGGFKVSTVLSDCNSDEV